MDFEYYPTQTEVEQAFSIFKAALIKYADDGETRAYKNAAAVVWSYGRIYEARRREMLQGARKELEA